MEFESILESIFPGVRTSAEKLKVLLPHREKRDPLERAGLHETNPSRYAGCPALPGNTPPVSLAEGFRAGRYVTSAVFHPGRRILATSISTRLPVFTCRVSHGVPRMIKSPVALPLRLITAAGTFDLLSEGERVFMIRHLKGPISSTGKVRAADVGLLEELIEAIPSRL